MIAESQPAKPRAGVRAMLGRLAPLRELGNDERGRRVVLLLAAVLALDTADVATVGSVAGQLERALSISNTELGLLVALPSLVGGLATLPVGALTDRVGRVRLLSASIVAWSLAMAVSGAATSFGFLLITRVALGAVTATGGPTVSSLIGDSFAPERRARIYGLILSGELVGAGIGFLISGEVASAFGWRGAFVALAIPSAALSVAVWRLMPEPQRGARRSGGDPAEAGRATLARRAVRAQHVEPRSGLILHEDPERMDLPSVIRYVLRVPTNVVLVLASALGYFYFSGVQTFGVVFFRGWYGLSHGAATALLALLGVGALAGVIGGGRLADRLMRQGHPSGRVLVGGVAYLVAAAAFLPALLIHSLAAGLPLYLIGACALAVRNPPLDAARLDIMHFRLWGRAEGVRTVLRRIAVAIAPLVFGGIADAVGGRANGSEQHGFGATANAQGLDVALIVLLVTVAAGGLLTLRAIRTYPRDVATAAASEEETRDRASGLEDG